MTTASPVALRVSGGAEVSIRSAEAPTSCRGVPQPARDTAQTVRRRPGCPHNRPDFGRSSTSDGYLRSSTASTDMIIRRPGENIYPTQRRSRRVPLTIPATAVLPRGQPSSAGPTDVPAPSSARSSSPHGRPCGPELRRRCVESLHEAFCAGPPWRVTKRPGGGSRCSKSLLERRGRKIDKPRCAALAGRVRRESTGMEGTILSPRCTRPSSSFERATKTSRAIGLRL